MISVEVNLPLKREKPTRPSELLLTIHIQWCTQSVNEHALSWLHDPLQQVNFNNPTADQFITDKDTVASSFRVYIIVTSYKDQ